MVHGGVPLLHADVVLLPEPSYILIVILAGVAVRGLSASGGPSPRRPVPVTPLVVPLLFSVPVGEEVTTTVTCRRVGKAQATGAVRRVSSPTTPSASTPPPLSIEMVKATAFALLFTAKTDGRRPVLARPLLVEVLSDTSSPRTATTAVPT